MSYKQGEILALIRDYIACSVYMCKSLRESYDTGGDTILRARRKDLIPSTGVLKDGFIFNFHGGGCYFEFEDSSIDIDFGPEDRCDGFESSRLYEFLKSSKRPHNYFFSESDIEDSLEKLLEEKIIIRPGWYPNPHLFYLSSNNGM